MNQRRRDPAGGFEVVTKPPLGKCSINITSYPTDCSLNVTVDRLQCRESLSLRGCNQAYGCAPRNQAPPGGSGRVWPAFPCAIKALVITSIC
jgi:hypothetical protein